MTKLKLFRDVGESMCRTMHADIIGSDDVAFTFFRGLAEELYPANKARRSWAEANMQLFYDQEKERIEIMKALTGKDDYKHIVDAMKTRYATEGNRHK